MENPLLWPILEVLRKKPSDWKVHTLAAHLNELGFMPILDASPDKDLFKRNFLIMNALYQLQETLAWASSLPSVAVQKSASFSRQVRNADF